MLSKELNSFIVAAECGSINRAAEKLHLSSPALWKHLNQVEEELGVRLFERTNRGVVLTTEGEQYYRDTVRLFHMYGENVKRVRNLAGLEKRVIRVGHSTLRTCYPLLELWDQEHAFAGQFEFEIVPFVDEAAKMRALFDDYGKEFDILIGICDVETCRRGLGINYLELNRMPFCVAVPYRHPLAKKERLEIEDLYGETLILLRTGSSVFVDRLHEELVMKHPEVNLDCTTHTNFEIDMFNRCVSENCLALTTEYWSNIHPSLRILPVNWNHYTTRCIMYPMNPSEDVQFFIQIIQERLKKTRE